MLMPFSRVLPMKLVRPPMLKLLTCCLLVFSCSVCPPAARIAANIETHRIVLIVLNSNMAQIADIPLELNVLAVGIGDVGHGTDLLSAIAGMTQSGN